VSLLSGTRLGPYEIIAPIGAGGMGEVYRAKDTRLDREVAIKVLSPGSVGNADAEARFDREARAVAALSHPNICTLYDVGRFEHQSYLVMELLDGETLHARLARGPLAVGEMVAHAITLADALQAAHARGLLHRDLKPANLFLTSRGQIKILDFGLTKAIESPEDATRLADGPRTGAGTTVGTLGYMSPEQLRGELVDARSDLFALGVVMYEMATGRRAFQGSTAAVVSAAILTSEPAPPRTKRPDLPLAFEAAIVKALKKNPAERYQAAAELGAHLKGTESSLQAAAAPPARARGPWLTVAVVVLAVGLLGGWFALQQSRVRRARTVELPRLTELIRKELPDQAYRLMRELEPLLADDPDFIAVRDGFLLPTTIQSTPSGADVSIRGYSEIDREWQHLGRTPIEMRLPRGYFRFEISKAGFTPLEVARGTSDLSFTLLPEGAVPSDMVRVPGGTARLVADDVPFGDFYLDKFEVTNRAFKAFVDAGAYRNAEFWKEPFVNGGRTLTFDQAMLEFRDATGRPGPSTWELGTFPDGQGDVPVHGISWYEAAAYAGYAGKALPTVHHWRRAASLGIYSDILEFSNFLNKGPAPVGTFKGIGEYGTYDMAGNVKEWCWNQSGDLRYILGGGWNEPNYQFAGADARPPFDRSANNGVRLMKATSDAAVPAATLDPIVRLVRDYAIEKPVSDDVFRIYARQFEYDPTDLKPVVESSDDSSPFWRVERITYNAAYNNERVVAYLFLPKNAKPPYQTLVYFPHSGGFQLPRFEQAEMQYLGFSIKAGRALLFPMYKGMYERRIPDFKNLPVAIRDEVVEQVKDLQRSVDYLATRSDIDSSHLAYFGVSYGARLASIALAIEHRFNTAVIWSGGFAISRQPAEVDELSYAPRVHTPVLMLNGRDDFNFPVETSQKAMFRMLGTPEADKKYILFDGGHIFPFNRIQKDTLDWLDKQLGVPR
jgi:formylglycine-generating enzyme required for sulfatase activity/predicted esterase